MQISANGIAIEVDDLGLPQGQPLLLIMGLGMQLTNWPEDMVQGLVARGFRVLRMDNRDIGLSQHFDHLGVPNVALGALRHMLHLPVAAPYRLADMADDAVGVLDALGLASAHVCGASMGGMIAQHMAVRHPQRVRSLTLIMTTSGSRRLPQPGMHVRRALIRRPADRSVASIAAHIEGVLRVIGSPAYPPDPQRLHEAVTASVQRSWHPAGTARQLMAVVADGDRSSLLPRIAAPTRVIHGRDDPLVPVAAGNELALRIPGAVADIIPGMGHDLPMQLLPRIVEGIADNAARRSVLRGG
jgi:pimeloyl-ACP methyl ester carboxylesterase